MGVGFMAPAFFKKTVVADVRPLPLFGIQLFFDIKKKCLLFLPEAVCRQKQLKVQKRQLRPVKP